MTINLPTDVSFILDTYKKNGFSAYVVGGCVRDALLGKTPTDWDICTDALPLETIKIFSGFKIIQTGIKHGTLTLFLDSVPYEITTFRTDGNYLDSRHPQSVEFVRNIEEDLKRRDFTVNSMAYNSDGIIDLYGGQSDLDSKIIRCVGDAKTRFGEDALRIMRAIRFCATLDFSIENETKDAIFSLKENLLNIATERINAEFTKIILSDNVRVFYDYHEIFKLFFGDTIKIDAYKLRNLPKDLETRLSYILIALDIDTAILEKLRYPSKIIKAVGEVIKNFDRQCDSERDLRLLISNSSYETAYKILTIKSCDIEMLLKVRDLPSKIQDLKICGDDLIRLGINDGVLIGRILNKLLHLVIDGNCENSKKSLIETAKMLMEGTV